MSKRFAKLQLLWLLSCVVMFLYYGISTFASAKINEESDFKPEYKHHVIDYASDDEIYELPCVYFSVYISIENVTKDEVNSTDLLHQLVESQNYFHNSVIVHSIIDGNVFVDVAPSTEGYHVISTGTGAAFWGKIKLELSDLDPNISDWVMVVLFDADAMTLHDTVSLEYLTLEINRQNLDWNEGQPIVLNRYAVEEGGEVDLFLLEYKEITTHIYKSSVEYHDFEVSWTQSQVTFDFISSNFNIDVNVSDIVLVLASDLKVEHWEQYVAFGYGSWVTGMGGLLSLTTATFFWISYYMAVYVADGVSMGILPGLSFNFSTYEEVNWIRSRLHKSGVL